MTYLALSIAAVVVVIAGVVLRMRYARPPMTRRPREPLAFAHVRVLRDDGAIREVAHRARIREQLIADEAQRRAAHFHRLLERGPGIGD